MWATIRVVLLGGLLVRVCVCAAATLRVQVAAAFKQISTRR